MSEDQAGSFDSWKGSSLALVFFVLISVLMVGPHIFPLTQVSLLPYAHEDSNIFLWGLWWVKRCLIEWHDPYWTDFLFYPLGMSLAFHTLPIPLRPSFRSDPDTGRKSGGSDCGPQWFDFFVFRVERLRGVSTGLLRDG